jgi:hypothetical protein
LRIFCTERVPVLVNTLYEATQQMPVLLPCMLLHLWLRIALRRLATNATLILRKTALHVLRALVLLVAAVLLPRMLLVLFPNHSPFLRPN